MISKSLFRSWKERNQCELSSKSEPHNRSLFLAFFLATSETYPQTLQNNIYLPKVADLSTLVDIVETTVNDLSVVPPSHVAVTSKSSSSQTSTDSSAVAAAVPKHRGGTKYESYQRRDNIMMHSQNPPPSSRQKRSLVVSPKSNTTDDPLEINELTSIGSRTKKRRRSGRRKAAIEPRSTERGHERSFVHHEYHDFAEERECFHSSDCSQASNGDTKNRIGINPTFPALLHSILEHAEDEGYSEVVSWQPHGRAFLVHDQERFVKEIMTSHFRQTRFSSFQRQLSLYGFLRLTRQGPDHSAYYHELFLRGMPHLCDKMERTRIKGYWVRQASSPATEPDFYSMHAVGSESSLQHTQEPIEMKPTLINPALFSGFSSQHPNIHVPSTFNMRLPSQPEPKYFDFSKEDTFFQAGWDIPDPEKTDLAAFLSDIDLESEEEDYGYSREDELEQIALRAQHFTSV